MFHSRLLITIQAASLVGVAQEAKVTNESFPLEFQHIFSDGEDDLPTTEKSDALDNFLDKAALAGLAGGFETVEEFQKAVAGINATDKLHYTNLAKAAADKSPEVKDGHALAKRAPVGTRIEKSANGRWEYRLGPKGELISGREIQS